MTPSRFSLTRPDDWHVHLRDGVFLQHTVAHTSRCFHRAVVMPNLIPPITTAEAARQYRQRILASVPAGRRFEPLMTLYLTDTLAPEEIRLAQHSGAVLAVKYYPAGATTNSGNGVTAVEKVYPALECMAELGMPLLLHGEVTSPEVDIFDREAVFIDQVLAPLKERFNQLPIVLEHITTQAAVEYIRSQSGRIAATITAHHLLLNRNHMLAGGIRPHFYCLPVLKRERHQRALVEAATGGDPRFFLGTDSAPHGRHTKEAVCGCAGVFTAHAAIELYAEAFEQAGALSRLEAFASFYGPDFYGLPRNEDRIELVRTPWLVPQDYQFGDSRVVPMRAAESISWQVVS